MYSWKKKIKDDGNLDFKLGKPMADIKTLKKSDYPKIRVEGCGNKIKMYRVYGYYDSFAENESEAVEMDEVDLKITDVKEIYVKEAS